MYVYMDNKKHTCPICMEESKESEMIKVKCGHFFHQRCLFLWTIQNPTQYKEISYYQHDLVPLTSSCPICRMELKQIFSLKECKYKKKSKSIRQWLARFL